jgi:pilus assembly protein CpaC
MLTFITAQGPPWRCSRIATWLGVILGSLLNMGPGQSWGQSGPVLPPPHMVSPNSANPVSQNLPIPWYHGNGVQQAGSAFVPGVTSPQPQPQISQSAILPVQNTADSARAVHHLIESLPTSHEDLEVIERRSQLMVTRQKVVRWAIADTAVIDVVQYSPRELGIIGLARGSTTLTLWFENHPEPLIYLVRTIRDPDWDNQRRLDYGRLEQKINRLFPNSKVYLIPMSRKILVRGQARDQEEAAHILAAIRGELIDQFGGLFGPQPYWGTGDAGGYAGLTPGGYVGGNFGNNWWNTNDLLSSFIINELRVPGEFQISLRVRIAELNRSQLRRMGIDLNVLFDNGNVTVSLDWLASNGTAKILTEPNVVVLSGRQARFLAGGEFAVPTVVGLAGAAGQTTSFRGFGTSLLVTPTVVERDLIRINAIAEYSDLNNANAVGGIPGTNARRVETTVELREGQTLALAGLLSHRTRTEVTRIPGLGDIPYIGPKLFSSKESTQEENELLILITPEIVRPMDPHEVPPVPGFEVTHPMDHELYHHNMVEGMPDTGYYQLPPYGSGSVGTNVGYQHFNPGPAGSMYSPQPTNPYGTGFSPPAAPPATGGYPSAPGGMVPAPASLSPSLMPRPLPPSPQAAQRAPQTGWSRPAAASQTIVPTNYNTPAPAARPSRPMREPPPYRR